DLGDPAVSAEIATAGGLARWTPGADARDFRRLWTSLRGYATHDAGRPPLWLAYGPSDRYAYGHRLLASALPADRVLVEPGGHDWPTWTRLWSDFLSRGAFPGRLGAPAILAP